MRAKQSAARALAAGVLSLALSCAMLLGTTYAWFTDTASTAVNTIEAGSLDVSLEMYNGVDENGDPKWVDAVGQTLQWGTFTGTIDTEHWDWTANPPDTAWAPGNQYILQPIRITNKGDIALKYKIVVNGISPSEDANDPKNAIEWTITEGSGVQYIVPQDISFNEYPLLPADSTTKPIVLSGRLKADASSSLQGKEIKNISITVLATQYTNESDSFGDQYDKDALYSALAPQIDYTRKTEVQIDSNGVITKAVDGTGIQLGINSLLYTDRKGYTQANRGGEMLTSQTGVLRETVTTTGGSDGVTYHISYGFTPSGETTEIPIRCFNQPIKYQFQLSTGLTEVTVTHKSDTEDDSSNAVSYDYKTNGILELRSTNFSDFEVRFKYDFEAAADGQGYTSLEDAMKAVSTGGTVTLLKDISRTTSITPAKSMNFDLGGNTVTSTSSANAVFVIGNGVACTITNGKIAAGNVAAILNSGTVNELSHLEITSNSSYALSNNGTIKLIDSVKVNNRLINDGAIETISNTTFGSKELRIAGHAINNKTGTIEKILSSSIFAKQSAISNNGTIGEINGILAKSNGDSNAACIDNSSQITAIKNCTIATPTTGVYNTGTIKTISYVAEATETASNAEESERVDIEAKVGIRNAVTGTIETVDGVNIVANALGIDNAGMIGIAADEGNPNGSGGIVNCRIKDAGTGIKNTGTILWIKDSSVCVNNTATKHYGILNDTNTSKIGIIKDSTITVEGSTDVGIRNVGVIEAIAGNTQITAGSHGISNTGHINAIGDAVTITAPNGNNIDSLITPTTP